MRPSGLRHVVRTQLVRFWRRLKRTTKSIVASMRGLALLALRLPRSDPPKKYPAVNRCIYCDADNVPLTDEHIIAEALGGNDILPKASCQDCQKFTTRAEAHCFGTMFKAVRERWKFPSKRKNRPKVLKLKITNPDGTNFIREIPAIDHPASILIIGPPPPSLLRNEFPASCYEEFSIWIYGNEKRLNAVTSDLEGRTINIASFHDVHFARMLAKTAHAFAVARRGYGSFKPLLTNLIREKTNDYSNFIGANHLLTQPRADSRIRMKLMDHKIDGKVYIVANIQLFASLGAPIFHVVVGEIERPADQCAPPK